MTPHGVIESDKRSISSGTAFTFSFQSVLVCELVYINICGHVLAADIVFLTESDWPYADRQSL